MTILDNTKVCDILLWNFPLIHLNVLDYEDSFIVKSHTPLLSNNDNDDNDDDYDDNFNYEEHYRECPKNWQFLSQDVI